MCGMYGRCLSLCMGPELQESMCECLAGGGFIPFRTCEACKCQSFRACLQCCVSASRCPVSAELSKPFLQVCWIQSLIPQISWFAGQSVPLIVGFQRARLFFVCFVVGVVCCPGDLEQRSRGLFGCGHDSQTWSAKYVWCMRWRLCFLKILDIGVQLLGLLFQMTY